MRLDKHRQRADKHGNMSATVADLQDVSIHSAVPSRDYMYIELSDSYMPEDLRLHITAADLPQLEMIVAKLKDSMVN